jgi:5-methylcytosine-specific restriction endonuclease McrA
MLPKEQFGRDPTRKGGFSYRCRACRSRDGAAWYQANLARRRAAIKAYSREHPEAGRAAQRRYRQAHPDRVRALEANRHAREVGAEGLFTAADWRALMARSPHCHWCKRRWSKELRPTHDHVIALFEGGENTLANSCLACSNCNLRKGRRPMNPTTGAMVLL